MSKEVMEQDELLLTNDEIVMREVCIPTGDSIGGKPVVRVEKEIDIDATLKAQLAKAKQHYEQKSPMYLDSKGQWRVRLDKEELQEQMDEQAVKVESYANAYYQKKIEEAKKQEKLNTLRELRNMWAYELAAGHPVMSINLDKWIKYCRKAGITDDWWELKNNER